MSYQIKHADVVPDGLFVTLKDGREALLNEQDVIDCAEKSDAFAQASQVRAATEADAAEEESQATALHP